MTDESLDPWFVKNVVCPVDRGPLERCSDRLVCANGHRYPVVEGVPVMLRTDVPSTIALAEASLQRAHGHGVDRRAPHLHLESLGISEDEKRGVLELTAQPRGVDPVVAYLIAATNGLMYRHLIGSLDSYPIPEMTLPRGQGQRLLDIGCSWGRWSIAADALGYDVIGIDPSLGAVMAARRVARQLGISNRYLVADARHVPFADGFFDATYSYSVLQHMSADDVSASLAEMGRLLRAGGRARVQMATRFGMRCMYHQARRRFRAPTGFEVRYWRLSALARLFSQHIGPARFEADCYFGIGLQAADSNLMTPGLRAVTTASEIVKSASRRVPVLIRVADSVFADALKTVTA
jgi:SAM-dependent methyltransferase/uncharacterized protein YbaR (Trm112 family)